MHNTNKKDGRAARLAECNEKISLEKKVAIMTANKRKHASDDNNNDQAKKKPHAEIKKELLVPDDVNKPYLNAFSTYSKSDKSWGSDHCGAFYTKRVELKSHIIKKHLNNFYDWYKNQN